MNLDADGHYVEVHADLRPLVEPAYRDQAPAFMPTNGDAVKTDAPPPGKVLA